MSHSATESKIKAIIARWEVSKRRAQHQLTRALQAQDAADAQLSQLRQLELDYARRRGAAANPSATSLANLARLNVQLDQALQRLQAQKDQSRGLVEVARAALLGWERKLLGLDRVRQSARRRSREEALRKERRSSMHSTRTRDQDIWAE